MEQGAYGKNGKQKVESRKLTRKANIGKQTSKAENGKQKAEI
jgi:hypothetical protein